MSKRLKACSILAIALMSMTMYAATTGPFLPGRRTVLLAHNSYPAKELNEILWKSIPGADSTVPALVHRF